VKSVLKHVTLFSSLKPAQHMECHENNITCFKTDSTCGAGLRPENNVTCFKTDFTCGAGCLKTRYIIFMS
jgi:hypothetical protein